MDGTHQVDVEDCLEIFERHIGERLVAQYAGVVHDNVDCTKCSNRIINDAPRFGSVGDRTGIGNGDAARSYYLVHNRLRGVTAAGAVHRPPEVIDNNPCAPARKLQCMGTAKAATRAGDDDYLVLEIRDDLGSVQVQRWEYTLAASL